MRVLLVNPDVFDALFAAREGCRLTGRKSFAPPLGLITLAALLPQEWEVSLVDLATRTVKEHEWNWADVVMITGMIVHRVGMIDIVREAKRRGKRVVVGGPYATSVPEEMMRAGADFILRGEAENAIPLLREALENSCSQSKILGPTEKPDITTMPTPRFDLITPGDYLYMAIQCSRGCPFDCEFCDVVNLLGNKVRLKSEDQVIRELDALYDIGWIGQVFVCDDNFIGSRKHAIRLLRRMIDWQEQRGKPFSFTTQASINLGRDNELIDLMTAARFGDVLIGIESVDIAALEKAGKHQNLRGSLEESVNNMKKNGLRVTGSFILGADGEEKGVGDRISEFIERTDMPIALVNTMWALPNTRLWNRLKSEGRLREEVCVESGSLAFPLFNFVPSRPAEEILDEYWGCCERIFEKSNYLSRVYGYFLAMRPTRKSLGIDGGASNRTQPVRPRRSLREIYLDVLTIFRALWRQGVESETRIQYWRQFILMSKKNPSRLRWYAAICAAGEDLFRLRRKMLERHRTAKP